MVTALTMRASVQFPDSFSPYLDPEPISDFFDDIGQRAGTSFSLAIVVHIGLFMMLHLQFSMPILPDEPEPIKIQIISFEPEAQPVPEVDLRPTIPAPAQAPVPKPKPKPKPAPIPEPIPEPDPAPEPEPISEPEPIPEPIPEPVIEPVTIPPAPEILTSESLEPVPEVVLEPLPEPEPIPEPLPEPIIEPLPIPQPEPIPDIVPEPIVEIFEPIPEPIPEPIIEPIPEPIVEIFKPIPEPEAIIEPLPEPIEEIPLAPIITETPVSGTVSEEPILEPLQEILPPVQEIVPDPIIETLPVAEPAPIPEPELEPEIIEPEQPVIISTPPTILASPDAPKTKAEEKIAVPSAGPTPLETILQNANPNKGGGNQGQIPIGAPPSGGTRPANPGAKGWTLAPGSYGGEPGKGYKGMILDIKCREEGRTHEDCPDYIPKYQGRDTSGFEEFGVHTPRGTSTTRNEAARSMNMNSSIIQGGTYGGPSAAKGGYRVGGNTDDNSGTPSTSVLDDVYLPNYDLSIPVPSGGPKGGRVRDIFNAPAPAPWTLNPDLPVKDEEQTDEFELLIIKPKAEN